MTHYIAKRVYLAAEPDDGYRVLVDRLWPRGVSKEKAHCDEWAKELAPTTELRDWFGHVPERFPEFRARYTAELEANPEFEACRTRWQAHPVVTLVFGAKDEQHNQAVVLRELLNGH